MPLLVPLKTEFQGCLQAKEIQNENQFLIVILIYLYVITVAR